MSATPPLQLPDDLPGAPWWARLLRTILTDDKALCRLGALMGFAALCGFHFTDVPEIAGSVVGAVVSSAAPSSSSAAASDAPAVSSSAGTGTFAIVPMSDTLDADVDVEIFDEHGHLMFPCHERPALRDEPCDSAECVEL